METQSRVRGVAWLDSGKVVWPWPELQRARLLIDSGAELDSGASEERSCHDSSQDRTSDHFC